jgi:hypothetical protein
MKTNGLYALAIRQQRGGLFNSKLFIVALIIALLFAAFPAASVLAAPTHDEQPWENIDLEQEWKNKLHQLTVEGLFFNQVRFYPADFENSADLARAWDLLHKHGFALTQANTVVFNHSGFDFEGNVINGRLAYETVHELAMHLHTMRGLRMKIAEEGHKIQRVRPGSGDSL